jgi:hypothetical protein
MRTENENTASYVPDSQLRLLRREYALFSRDIDTIHRLRRLHGFRTAAEAVSYVLRAYGEPELDTLDIAGSTIQEPHAEVKQTGLLQRFRRSS